MALGAALLLVALNLRYALAAVPPVLDDVRRDVGLSNVAAGLLTTVPVLCFGLAAALVPMVARRLGQETVVLACVLAIAAGVALRALPTVSGLFAGTVLFGAAIAVANVVVPSIIKRRYVRPGVMMGLYTACLSVGAALGAGVTVPLEGLLGSWQLALLAGVALALVSALVWLPHSLGAGHAPTAGLERPLRLAHDPVAWRVTAAFGTQTVLFYCLVAWLPDILRDAGLAPASVGGLFSIAMLLGIPGALIVPVLAGRMRDQRPLALLAPGCYAGGFLGLLLAPETATAVWMVLLGIGNGAGISMALTLVVLRSPDGAHAASLSGMAQGVGYTLAAGGPAALGALRDLSGAWTQPLMLLLAGCAALLLAGLGAGRPGLVAGASGPRVGGARVTRVRGRDR